MLRRRDATRRPVRLCFSIFVGSRRLGGRFSEIEPFINASLRTENETYQAFQRRTGIR